MLVLCFLKGFPVPQGSIISSIGYGINAIISAIAAVIETIVGAIVAVRTVLLSGPLNLIRICYRRYLWRFSTLFSTFYAVAALVGGADALEAGLIIVGEDFSAAAGVGGPLRPLLAHTNVLAVGALAMICTEDLLAGLSILPVKIDEAIIYTDIPTPPSKSS